MSRKKLVYKKSQSDGNNAPILKGQLKIKFSI